MENNSLKLCPFCKEQIRKEAVKCRFCGEWLEQPVYPASNQLVAQEPPKSPLAAVAEKTAPAPESPTKPAADEIPTVIAPENREKTPPKVETGPYSEAPAKPTKPSLEDLARKLKFLDVAPKKLYLIGAGFLLLGVMVVWMFRDVDFSRGDPGKVSSLMAAMILKPILGAAALAWAFHSLFGKRKGYRFLLFSITWAVVMAWCSITFREALNASRTKSQVESTRQMAASLNDLVQQATNEGTTVQLKATGDASIDAAMQPIVELASDFRGALGKMEAEITALKRPRHFNVAKLKQRKP